MKLLQIPPEITDQVWAAVEPYLKRACDFSKGTHTTEAVKERVKLNLAQLWAVVEDEKPHKVIAAGTTSIVDYPNGARALMIELLSGENMKLWYELKNDLEKWAKENGCKLSYCWARKGWVKHLSDYQLTHYLLYKDLSA